MNPALSLHIQPKQYPSYLTVRARMGRFVSRSAQYTFTWTALYLHKRSCWRIWFNMWPYGWEYYVWRTRDRGPLLCKLCINRVTNLIKNVCLNIQSLEFNCNEHGARLWIDFNLCRSYCWECEEGSQTVLKMSPPAPLKRYVRLNNIHNLCLPHTRQAASVVKHTAWRRALL
jgi:hypothetical protein